MVPRQARLPWGSAAARLVDREASAAPRREMLEEPYSNAGTLSASPGAEYSNARHPERLGERLLGLRRTIRGDSGGLLYLAAHRLHKFQLGLPLSFLLLSFGGQNKAFLCSIDFGGMFMLNSFCPRFQHFTTLWASSSYLQAVASTHPITTADGRLYDPAWTRHCTGL